jgi:hypothetical protein
MRGGPSKPACRSRLQTTFNFKPHKGDAIMGRKSRLKQERKQQGIERELRRHPMMEEIRAFLQKRRITTNKASGLLYVVSLLASFLIHHSIKKHVQLPVINPEEDKADENRLERLARVLEYECQQFHIESQEIMNELVFPMVGNEAFMEPILRKVYEMLDSLIPSDSFRQPTEAQIENPDLWGDSLAHYADRKEEYFQTVKELVALLVAVSRSTLDAESKEIDHQVKLEEIRKTYGIEPGDFEKVRRRATEFYKIAFAKYLSMVFQTVREEVDEKVLKAGSISQLQRLED